MIALTFVLTRLGFQGEIHKLNLFLRSFLLFLEARPGENNLTPRLPPGSCRCGIFIIKSSSMAWDEQGTPRAYPGVPGLGLLGILVGMKGQGMLSGRCFVLLLCLEAVEARWGAGMWEEQQGRTPEGSRECLSPGTSPGKIPIFTATPALSAQIPGSAKPRHHPERDPWGEPGWENAAGPGFPIFHPFRKEPLGKRTGWCRHPAVSGGDTREGTPGQGHQGGDTGSALTGTPGTPGQEQPVTDPLRILCPPRSPSSPSSPSQGSPSGIPQESLLQNLLPAPASSGIPLRNLCSEIPLRNP